MNMRGDNFRPVNAETASWVLQQHFAMQDVPIDVCGTTVAQRRVWITPKPERAAKLTMRAKRILIEVSEKYNCPWTLVSLPFGTGRVNRARQEFWARCRAEILIEKEPASYFWIARQTGHHSTSVVSGIRAYRRRMTAENAEKSMELTAKRVQNQSRDRDALTPRHAKHNHP